MSAPGGLVFEKTVDDYSYQVFTASDKRFWFRLERRADRDVITDFFLGSFPAGQSGQLLADCYWFLGLRPKPIVVFKDILSGNEAAGAALERASDLYRFCGSYLLRQFGASRIDDRITREREKWNLVLSADSG